MIRTIARLCRFRRDDSGSMAIETAIVAPILLVLALAGFDVSSMVARQTELQSAAAEAAAVVRAVVPETAAERNTVRNILRTSTGLNGDGQVAITEVYRCGTATEYVIIPDTCGSGTQYKFIKIALNDTYSPIWTKFGITSGFNYNITRTVQIG